MSEIKVNKISPATSTDITLGDSGDTFTVPSGATIVNSGTATGFGGGGKILQVVQLQMTGYLTTTSTSEVDMSGYTKAITPTAASSKILVCLNYHMSGSDSYANWTTVYRDIEGAGYNKIAMGDSASNRTRATFVGYFASANHIRTFDLMWLDEPSYTLTDVITYKTKWCQKESGGTYTINGDQANSDTANRTREASTITLWEIGA